VTGSGLEIERAGAATLRLEDTGSGGKPLEIYSDDGEGYVINGVSSGMPMIFKNNNTERMRIDTSGNVGIGATSPSSTFRTSINGDGSSIIGGVEFRNAVSGGSTFTVGHATATSASATLNVVDAANLIMKTNDTERLRIDSSGNVGIGTSSPGAKLNAVVAYSAGTIVPSLKLATVGGYNTGSGTAIDFGQDQDTYSTWVTGRVASPRTAASWGGSLTFSTNDDSSATALVERMRLDSSGNVGIGTSSATQRLSVKGTNSTAGQTGADVTMDVYDDSTGGIDVGGAIGFRGNDGTNSNVMFGEVSGRKENATSGNYASYMGFKTRAHSGGLTERLRIDSSGNVGIGTTSPSSMLHLYGTDPILKFQDSAGGDTFGAYVSNTAGFGIYNFTDSRQDLTISGDGNVGIGTTSPTYNLVVSNSGAEGFEFIPGFSAGLNLLQTYNRSASVYDSLRFDSADYRFTIGGAEKMRLDSNGDLLVGTTTANGDGVTISGRQGYNFWLSKANTTSGYNHLAFHNPNGAVGNIQTSSTATAYLTSSDYRLKENVTATWDATTRLKQLNPVRFNFISDADTTVDGFLAHEVQSVVPEAISGTHNGMRDEEYEVSAATGDIYTPATEAVLDEDGNEVTPAVAEVIHSTDVERPEALAEGQQWRETTAAVMGTRSVPDYQGIDQSKLVPLLVKTIQELEARITALETAE